MSEALRLTAPWTPALAMATEHSADRDRVRRAAAGDVEAFEELFRRHQGRVYALCLRMTGDPALADDLTQDAFVRAWDKLGTFRARSAFSTWMHRLTVNVVLGALRKRARRGDQALPEPEAAPEPRPATNPEAGVDLERAIAGLPPQARLVFVLHDVEGFKHREIAERTGLAEGTSKAHLHRARRLLREALRR